MIKNNIFFAAAASNAAFILLVLFLINDDVVISRYLEFLLILQTITFCDFGLSSFCQKFSARIYAGVSFFEYYGDEKVKEHESTICKYLLYKFLFFTVTAFSISCLFSFSFIFLLNHFGFYKSFTANDLIFCIVAGIAAQTVTLQINCLIGLNHVILAKMLEIINNRLRICLVIILFFQ